MPTELKFLHCLPKFDYLKQAIGSGFLLTSHEVHFNLSEKTDAAAYKEFIDFILPVINLRLGEFNSSFENLSDVRKGMVLRGVAGIQGNVPMLCFTEVPEGRNIVRNKKSFGNYGFVIKREWLQRNNADRVIYIGQNSPVSNIIFKLAGVVRALMLMPGKENEVLFNNSSFELFGLIKYVQNRSDLEELEWRIAGDPGWSFQPNDEGKRLPITLNDIEYIFVSDADEVEIIKADLKSLCSDPASLAVHESKIMIFPDVLP